MGKECVQDAAYRYCYRARVGAGGEARAARPLVENGGARTLAEGVPTAALVQHSGDERGGGGDCRRDFASGLRGRLTNAALGAADVSPATPEARMGHCPIVKQTLFASAGAFKEYRFSI